MTARLAADFEKYTAITKPDAAGSVEIIDETVAGKVAEATQSTWDLEVNTLKKENNPE
jgi:hypothetical protein